MASHGSSFQKTFLGAAGTSDDRIDIEQYFSTDVWVGDGSSDVDIVNNIDLTGQGGAVWWASRSTSAAKYAMNTVTGASKRQSLHTNDSEGTENNFTFNSNGYRNNSAQGNTTKYVGWTFRNQDKFFKVFEYTGNGSNRTIAHNLGSTPGCIMIHDRDNNEGWTVYHRGMNRTDGSASDAEIYQKLHTATSPTDDATVFQDTAPTATVFSLGTNDRINKNSVTYVAYVFGHTDSEDLENELISCGSYNGSGSIQDITIGGGWEPQWIMTKDSEGGDFYIFDDARGMSSGFNDHPHHTNSNGAEYSFGGSGAMGPDQGKGILLEASNSVNRSGRKFWYIAIRVPMMGLPPTDPDTVFKGTTRQSADPCFPSPDFRVDAGFQLINNDCRYYNRKIGSRTPYYIKTYDEDEFSSFSDGALDQMFGVGGSDSAETSITHCMFKNQAGFMNFITYRGESGTRSIKHGLNAVPKIMFIKNHQASNSKDWIVYHKDAVDGSNNNQPLYLNENNAQVNADYFNGAHPTDSVFSLSDEGLVNQNNEKYFNWMFTSCAGVCDIGTYNGTGGTQNLDFGFANGTAFFLTKRVDSTGNWFLFHEGSSTGIVSGNDEKAKLNTGNVSSGEDLVDPLSSGITLTNAGGNDVNNSGGKFVYLAIAAGS